MAGIESMLFLANIGFSLYLLILNILAAILHAGLYKLRNTSRCMSQLNAKLGKYLYWEGLNRLYMELFFELTLFSILNLYTVDWNAKFTSVIASNFISVFIIILVSGVQVIYIVGYFR